MVTKVIKIDNDIPSTQLRQKLKEPSKALKEGFLVAFPTETVYGLGANALDENAVKAIFAAKGRPSDNPLIVHVADYDEVEMLAYDISATAKILMEEYWPGPLTLVMNKKPRVPDIVTAGLDTVAVRMPSHPIAIELIKMAGVPVAAPSANISGKPSPTKASHVLEDFEGSIPYIIDGGDCRVGLESTVLDVRGDVPRILRPGDITPEDIIKVAGDVIIDKTALSPMDSPDKIASPGMKYTHYSPDAEVIVVTGDNIKQTILKIAEEYNQKGKEVGVLAWKQTINDYSGYSTLSMGSLSEREHMGTALFGALRDFDSMGVDYILAEGITAEGKGLALMNRLLKAAGYKVVQT